MVIVRCNEVRSINGVHMFPRHPGRVKTDNLTFTRTIPTRAPFLRALARPSVTRPLAPRCMLRIMAAMRRRIVACRAQRRRHDLAARWRCSRREICRSSSSNAAPPIRLRTVFILSALASGHRRRSHRFHSAPIGPCRNKKWARRVPTTGVNASLAQHAWIHDSARWACARSHLHYMGGGALVCSMPRLLSHISSGRLGQLVWVVGVVLAEVSAESSHCRFGSRLKPLSNHVRCLGRCLGARPRRRQHISSSVVYIFPMSIVAHRLLAQNG